MEVRERRVEGGGEGEGRGGRGGRGFVSEPILNVLYSFRQLVECHEDTETKMCGKGGREGCSEGEAQ